MQGNDGWVTVPEDQLEASNLSIYICTAQYPIRPEFLSPLTDRQFAVHGRGKVPTGGQVRSPLVAK